MRTAARTALALAALGAAACGDGNGGGGDDAMTDPDAGAIADARIGSDGNPSLSWVDFSITGCAAGAAPAPGGVDAGPMPAPCVGPAPLELRFTAVTPAPVDVYLWVFGDGAEDDTTASPVHLYELPGTYDVSLSVGGPGGTASVDRPGAVVVAPAPLGYPCDTAEQCAATTCVCGDGASCAPSLASGLCTDSCSDTAPCADGVCADLAPGGASAEPWQASLCVPACADDGDCPAALTCRALRAGDGSGGWVSGCFADGLLGDIGASCADAGGNPDDDQCAGGLCLDEGARGLCSAACTDGTCPDGSACATFGGGGSYCLARCVDAGDCTGDPGLACEAPGGAGAKGFTVDEAPAAMGYCAPRTCAAPAECGPDGTCIDGYCAID